MVSGYSHMECNTAHALIEKKKKKRTNMRIQHPRDWEQLIRSVGTKSKFNVTEIDFESLFSSKLQIKNKDSKNDKLIWRDCQWMRFVEDQTGIIHF